MSGFDHQELDRLGRESQAAVMRVWSAWRAMRQPELVRLSSEVLALHAVRAQMRGRAYARIALLQPEQRVTVPRPSRGRRYVPLPSPDWDSPEGAKGGGAGRIEDDPTERYQQAFTTIYEDDPEDTMRVERLAYDEPIQAAQAGFQYQAAQDGEIKGYRRQINPDACQVCFWLWKEGYVYPITKPMWRHTGCRCVPVPTTDRIGSHPLTDAELAMLDEFMDRYQ